MSGLRVLLLANTLPPRDVSGVGEQVLQLAAGLRTRGHRVEVLGRAERGVGASKLLFPLTSVPRLLRAVRRLRPDVVQVHESDGALAALALTLWRRWPARGSLRGDRPRLVALLQVSYVEERRAVRPLVAPDGRVLARPGPVERRFRRWKAPLQIALGRLTARRADRVLCPSAATAAEIERDYRVAGVRVLPNVTGGTVTGGDGVPVQEERAEEGAGPLLFVGRLRLRKGVEVLLEALAELRGQGVVAPPVRIAGEGEHRTALERRTGELGLTDRVEFLGRGSAETVRALLATSCALVVPSIYEGMPLVVLEAMAAGLPVIASRVSGIPEVVIDGETGRLVPPEDPSALAAALAELIADSDQARRRGTAGRRRVDRLFRPEHAAAIWEREVGDGDVEYSPSSGARAKNEGGRSRS